MSEGHRSEDHERERFRDANGLVNESVFQEYGHTTLAQRVEFPVHGIWIYSLGRAYTVPEARALRDWLNKVLP